MLVVVWQYRQAPGREGEFVEAYGPGGPWVSLFRKSDGYRETMLLQDTSDPRQFLVLDWWESEASLATFRRDYAPDYAALDEQCRTLHAEERLVGSFRVPRPDRPGRPR